MLRAVPSTQAEQALRYIADLYRIEADASGLGPPQRQAYRDHPARPITAAIQLWIADAHPRVANGSDFAKALDRTLRRWSALAR